MRSSVVRRAICAPLWAMGCIARGRCLAPRQLNSGFPSSMRCCHPPLFVFFWRDGEHAACAHCPPPLVVFASPGCTLGPCSSLVLAGCGLAGVVPGDISLLSGLQELYLFNNPLTSIGDGFERLPALTYVSCWW